MIGHHGCWKLILIEIPFFCIFFRWFRLVFRRLFFNIFSVYIDREFVDIFLFTVENRVIYQYRFYYRDIWTLDDSKLWQRYNNKNNNNNRKQQQQQLWIFHVMTLGNYTMANGMSWGSAVTVHCLNNRIETSYSQWHTIDRGESLMNRTASLALKTQQIGFSYSLATSWVLSFTLFCQFYNL